MIYFSNTINSNIDVTSSPVCYNSINSSISYLLWVARVSYLLCVARISYLLCVARISYLLYVATIYYTINYDNSSGISSQLLSAADPSASKHACSMYYYYYYANMPNRCMPRRPFLVRCVCCFLHSFMTQHDHSRSLTMLSNLIALVYYYYYLLSMHYLLLLIVCSCVHHVVM